MSGARLSCCAKLFERATSTSWATGALVSLTFANGTRAVSARRLPPQIRRTYVFCLAGILPIWTLTRQVSCCMTCAKLQERGKRAPTSVAITSLWTLVKRRASRAMDSIITIFGDVPLHAGRMMDLDETVYTRLCRRPPCCS